MRWIRSWLSCLKRLPKTIGLQASPQRCISAQLSDFSDAQDNGRQADRYYQESPEVRRTEPRHRRSLIPWSRNLGPPDNRRVGKGGRKRDQPNFSGMPEDP